MKNLQPFVLSIAIILACSCKDKKETSAPMLNDTAPANTVTVELPVIDLQKEYPKKTVCIQDYADIEYIPLETHENALLTAGHLSSMKWTEDILAVNDFYAIHFFDRLGKYLSSINKKGSSGEEYNFISSFTIDPKAKEVFIYDFKVLNNKLLVYDIDGTFKRRIPLKDYTTNQPIFDYSPQELITCDIFNLDKKDESIPTSNQPYYKISKQDGTISLLPIVLEERFGDALRFHKNDLSFTIKIGVYPFVKSGDDLIISDFAMDTVYSFKDDKLKPIAVRQNRYKENGNPILATLLAKTNRYQFWDVCEKNIEFDGQKASVPDPQRMLFDRFTGECFYFDEFDNADGIPADSAKEMKFSRKLGLKSTEVEPNCITQAFEAEFLINQYNDGKLSGQLKEIASKLQVDDNPVLMIARFRE
ncbi:MAG: 6-bladed beta-propeller [Tannerellaceae bacterium]